jgi:hypothetical protein
MHGINAFNTTWLDSVISVILSIVIED